jgi:3',5'-cyclic AMP phosphodiesterase CpdA
MKNEPFRILILSNIHFGSWSHYACDYSPALTKPREWAARLLQELGVCLQPPGVVAPPPYDSIVLNGDLTSLCEEDGFAAARILVNGLIKENYIRSAKEFVLLPGNHDVRRDPGVGPRRAR